jgi:large subunit ribosomal protein L7/L12
MVLRCWTPDVRTIGDRIAALTPNQAAQLRDYLAEVHRVRICELPARIEDRLLDNEPPPPDVDPLLDVILEAFDPARKILVIREVRELTGLPLMQARDLCATLPAELARGLTQSDAERFKARLADVGARVVLR